MAGIAGGGGFSAEAFFPLEGEGFEGSGGKFEADASGRIGSCHLEGGVGFTLEGPVGDPDLHIFLGNFHLSECASAEFFGEDEATGLNIGDSEVSEVDVADRPSRVGLGGFRLQSVAKEGEFIAVGIAFFVVEVAGEVPPFGFKLGVSSVIARKGPGPGGEGTGPGLGRMEERGGEGKEKNGEKLFHSERRASAQISPFGAKSLESGYQVPGRSEPIECEVRANYLSTEPKRPFFCPTMFSDERCFCLM